MSPTELAAITVAVATSIGGVAACVYAFRNNASSIKNDVINAYEKRVGQLEDDMEEMKKKLDEALGLLKKREAELETLTRVMQGRNPEFELFMTTVGATAKMAPLQWGRMSTMLETLLMKFDLPVPDRLPS